MLSCKRKGLPIKSGVDMLHDYFLKARFFNFNADKIEVLVAQADTSEQLLQA
jgi:hypothetical protein